MTFNNKKFSSALKKAIGNKSHAQVARDCKVERTALYRYEAGEMPPTVYFARICQWLNVPMEHFFTSK